MKDFNGKVGISSNNFFFYFKKKHWKSFICNEKYRSNIFFSHQSLIYNCISTFFTMFLKFNQRNHDERYKK